MRQYNSGPSAYVVKVTTDQPPVLFRFRCAPLNFLSERLRDSALSVCPAGIASGEELDRGESQRDVGPLRSHHLRRREAFQVIDYLFVVIGQFSTTLCKQSD
jgi:hypothetical protein